ncbi:MAG: TetR/AcrR family transcriptional regulator C-terminal domain-containing protein [Ornithinimicrobium sp.]|uniref:TetR/AcrR family transcriptional regulator C-terminal domain-containing protein n=1 Tax=Ornithinimicrobium sp. TaxID=1977084 RepID=UPI003D9B7D38
MTETTAPPRRIRPRLDRELIVVTALGFIDEQGTEGLTMRKLGQELGVEAMSLYRHVSGREDLLEAVVAHLLSGIDAHLDEQIAGSWQGYLQTLAHEVRGIAVEHPAAFPLVATRHPAAPWLRPPLRSIELVEHFLSTLARHGFDDQHIVQTYRGFTGFLLGALLLESVAHGGSVGPADEPLDEGGADLPHGDGMQTLSDAPTTQRLQPLLSEDHSAEEFEIGLETLLDRLEMSLSQ